MIPGLRTNVFLEVSQIGNDSGGRQMGINKPLQALLDVNKSLKSQLGSEGREAADLLGFPAGWD